MGKIDVELSTSFANVSTRRKVVTYEKKDAITLPQASVFKEDHDPDQKYVYILSPKGKPVKKIIETGKSFGTSIEVINGIRPNSKILKEKPEA